MHTNLSDLKLDMKSIIRYEDRLSDSFDFEIKVPVQKSRKEDVKPIIHTKPKGKKLSNTKKSLF
jgi:hypothetical protein|uniref:Uncharacterized protein n=1 Tax=Myoviridae sp. ctA4D8 TaxID=2823535 RepID=A0A8S5L6P0_9CAUD|nr:MAG TPA: hypothetical protein [Myoviridae sp. ctA4D8]